MSVNSQIDEFFAQWFTDDSPGMAIAVTRHGNPVHKKAYGMADLDHGIRNETDTVFHCASLAKQFTAMSILLLAQQKDGNGEPIITLDDALHKHIPDLPERIQPITIRQLLHHTSGIRDMLVQLTLAGWRWGDDAITRDDVLDLVREMKTLNFEPDARDSYSNTNYFLAGEIVALKSKEKSLAAFARQNIFEPLGMKSTRFVDSYCETVENRAYGYRRRTRANGESFYEKRIPNYDLSGPTNLFTTVDDLLLWDANFVAQNPLGGRNAVDAMQRPTEKSNGYGLGLQVYRYANGEPRKIYHNGRTIGHRAHLVHDYDTGIAIAMLCNVEFSHVDATDKLADQVSEIVQGRKANIPILDHHKLRDPEGARPAEALAEYCGTYYNSEIDTAYEVTMIGTRFVIKRPRYSDYTTLDDFPGPDDTFVAKDFTAVLREITVTFLRGDNSAITGFKLDWSRYEGSRLVDLGFVKQK